MTVATLALTVSRSNHFVILYLINIFFRELRAEVEALKGMLLHAAQPALLREKLSENEKLVQVSKPNQTKLLHAAQPALLREKLPENEKLDQVSQTPNHAAVHISFFPVCSTLRARTN